MAESKLSKSLDDIVKDSVKNGNAHPKRRANLRRSTGATTRAPVGGIQKSSREKPTVRPLGKSSTKTIRRPGKVMIKGLPADVTKAELKKYLEKRIGPILGDPEIFISETDPLRPPLVSVKFRSQLDAEKAVKTLDGVQIDKKPIQVILDGDYDNTKSKTLADRVSQPKSQKAKTQTKAPDKPKSVMSSHKNGTSASNNRGIKQGRNARNARPVKKTLEELDHEMADYYQSAPADNANNGNATGNDIPVAENGGDAPMDDIL